MDWLLEDLRCHSGEIELLAPDLLARLARLNREHGLGVAPAGGAAADCPGPVTTGAGGWLELELLYRLRLGEAPPDRLAVELGVGDAGRAEELAELAAEYLRSRGVPL